MTVNPGDGEIRIRAMNITGEELFKVRSLELTPVLEP